MSLSPKLQIQRAAVYASVTNRQTGFYSFVRLAFAEMEGEELLDNWHIQHVCHVLQKEANRVKAGKPKDLDIIYTLPPQTLKTSVIVCFNAWLWITHSNLSILTINATIGEAESATSRTKNLINSDWYVYHFGTMISKSRGRDFTSQTGGKRYSTGIHGRGVPEKVDFVFLDSVLEIGRSDKTVERDRVFKAFNTRFKYSLRNNDRGVFFILQDIKHPDGLVGRLLEKTPKKYKRYSLPADDRGDIVPKKLKRFYDKADGLLFPQRIDREYLEQMELDDPKFQSRYLLRTTIQSENGTRENNEIDRAVLLNCTDVETLRSEIERIFFGVTYVFTKNWFSKKDIVNNRGGTRSSKTFSICQQLVLWLFTGIYRHDTIIETGRATIVREHSVTLSLTVQKTLETEILKVFSLNGRLLYDYVEHKKVLREYHFKGRVIALMGANEGQKLRGYKGDILYCNEANELQYKGQFFQLMIRTTNKVVIDHNPSDPYVWIKTELEEKRTLTKGDVDTIVSTYKDNPFLPQRLVDEVEYYKETDEALWKVYGLGEYGKVEGLVLNNWEIIDKMPPLDEMSKVAGWCDFGFTHPFALGVCGMIGEDLYVDEYVYEQFKTNQKLIELAELNEFPQIYTVADSAKPGDIEEWKNNGFLFDGVVKYKNSIEHGLGLLKKVRKIYITSRSTGLRREVMKYKYIVDKDGNTLPIPHDSNNHAIDGIRYYAMTFLQADTRESKRRGAVI